MNPKKKILFVITKSNWGGAQKYVFDLATSLPGDEYEVLVALGGEGELKAKLQSAQIETISIPHLERDIRIWKEPLVFFALCKIIYKCKPDILHLNSSKIGGIGSVAGRLMGISSIIFTAHGFAFNENRSFIQKPILKLLYLITILFSTTTICISRAMQQQLQQWPLIRKKLVVIHNGIKPIHFVRKVEARSALQAHIEDNTYLLGTVAELHPIKGLEVAIHAVVALHADYRISYLIIGEGELRATLEKIIRDNHAKTYIQLVGALPDAAQYLKAFDAFILPSYSEGLGLSVIEAGFAHLPTISTRVGGIPEIIVDKKTGLLVEPGSERDIVNAISYLIEHPKESQRLAKNLEEEVRNDFTFERCLEKTLEVYRNNLKT